MLEAREVSATYLVSLGSPVAGEAGTTAATISGSLDLNAAHPSVPEGILVEAATAEDAVRGSLFGRVGARQGALAFFYDYGADTTGTAASDHKPFLIRTNEGPSQNTHTVFLEDMAGHTACDWDFNDRSWGVNATLFVQGVPGRPPEPIIPPLTLELLNEFGTGMTDLRVSKWKNAYELVDGKVVVKSNFVVNDEDRFSVRITRLNGVFESNAVVDVIEATVFTTSDTGNKIRLVETAFNSGVFVSKSLLLVSNTVDDQYELNGRVDGAVNDQTFLVKLGDQVTIQYVGSAFNDPNSPTVTKKAPVRILKDAKVHITVMTKDKEGVGTNNSGNAYATEAQVNEWMNFAQQQYAQVGVRLVWTVQFADQPKKVNAADVDVDLSNGLLNPIQFDEAEARGMVRGRFSGGPFIRTQTEDDIELFFYNYFSNSAGGEMEHSRGFRPY
jgi:hypothetical protein